MSAERKAIFLDRDGVINEMVYDDTHGLLDSPRRVEDVRIITGAGSFIARVRRAGWLVIVVTNQPGIAKGYFDLPALEAVNCEILRKLIAEGGPEAGWDDLIYCPFHPSGRAGIKNEFIKESPLRKPEPGMLLEAAARHGIDLAASWMIGDGLVDVQAGRRAGCRTILVAGVLKIETIERFVSMRDAYPDHVVRSLADVPGIM